ncbi:YceD family protein [Liquorilactobacillus mali]|uniref:Nucleic acid-binding protein n=1 Tax=Liquorilactobacillus mali KCTC 3596 = DSM 20444 TaxID=1046596 RepID=A0A0R2E296_9LACO|nr:YceD family protein [Liquorilactobacillus mali]KRN10514.1 hypothetical protein FD00_GL002470 [Liquorilactobacillus mali KCTC 3596 = DSM 20444]MDC7951880.1 DUF177 domain-containing protein [Liquorilactobacillus mali]QFQ75068.1 DUF177 domain-containing protein [Liquorilactobacillus mali]
MKWSLNELGQIGSTPFHFEEVVNVADSIVKRNSEITAISPAQVSGFFVVDSLGLLGSFKVSVKVTLPSTRSLKVVEIPLDFEVSEYYVSHRTHDLSRFDAKDVVIILEDDILDLNQAVEDNILLQIPTRILTAEEEASEDLPQGKGWEVSEDGRNNQKQRDKDTIDPRLAKLKDFFDKKN